MFIWGMVGVCAAAAPHQEPTITTAAHPTSLLAILSDDRHVIAPYLLTFRKTSR
jgi:hypothetical protein